MTAKTAAQRIAELDLLREARDALDGVATMTGSPRWDLAIRIAAFLERPQEATGTKCKTCYDVGSVAVFYFDRRLPNMPCPDCAPRKPEVGRVGFLLERIMTALGHLEIEAPDVEQSKAVLRTALTKADRQ